MTDLKDWQTYLACHTKESTAYIDLGKIYESYITLNPVLRASLGVFYTPVEIVNYMLEHTLGTFLAGKRPENIQDLKILDPSCGCGSFLIGAFDFLLNWYAKFQEKMDSVDKLAILQRHIFGIDIDAQAIEITKFSLLVYVFENSKNIDDTLLSQNILQSDALNMPESYAQIFDIIIGNPPYGAELHQENYIRNKFPFSSQMKEINSYLYFIEMSLRLMKPDALLGFIIPDTFLLKNQYTNFRKFLLDFTNIKQLVETGSVFSQAKATPNVLLILEKNPNGKNGNIQNIMIRKQLDYTKSTKSILQDLELQKWSEDGQLIYKDWKKSYDFQLGHFVKNEKVAIIEKIIQNPKNVLLITLPNIDIDRGLEGGKSSLLEKSRKKKYTPNIDS